MSAEIVSLPGYREPTEQEALASIVAAFEALPDAYQSTVVNLLVNVLADRLQPAYARAVGAMLAERYPAVVLNTAGTKVGQSTPSTGAVGSRETASAVPPQPVPKHTNPEQEADGRYRTLRQHY